jgi:LacI family transcriptional regulator
MNPVARVRGPKQVIRKRTTPDRLFPRNLLDTGGSWGIVKYSVALSECSVAFEAKGSMPTTLKQVADSLGLAQTTVSQVLRGKGSFPPATRQRILQRAKELRYRPSGVARAMREGRTGIIGFIYTTEGTKGNIPPSLLHGIQRALVEHSFDLMLGELTNDHLSLPGVASELQRSWMADGLLINNQMGLPQHIEEMVAADQVPAIWLNSHMPHNSVLFADRAAGREATEHVIGLGHRRIAYVDYSHPMHMIQGQSPEHYSVTERVGGYLDAMQAAGLAPRIVAGGEGLARTPASRQVLGRPDRPTAVVSYGETSTLPVMFAAGELGLRIPTDLSIVHFSAENRGLNDLEITRSYQDFEALGSAGVGRLMELLMGRTAPGPLAPLEIPMPLRLGQSTAPPIEP